MPENKQVQSSSGPVEHLNKVLPHRGPSGTTPFGTTQSSQSESNNNPKSKPCEEIKTDGEGLDINKTKVKEKDYWEKIKKSTPYSKLSKIEKDRLGETIEATGGGKTHEATFALAQVINSIIGGKHFSLNDAFHQYLSPSSVHTTGLALDFVLPGADEKRYAEIAEKVRKIGEQYGINIYVRDEKNFPSPKSTGPHIHVGFGKDGIKQDIDKKCKEAQKFLAEVKRRNEDCTKKKQAKDGIVIQGKSKDPCDKSKMTKEERFIYDNREAIKKAAKKIDTKDIFFCLDNDQIDADLIGAIMLDELQRRNFGDSVQETEARFIDFYEGPFESVERWLLSQTFKPIEDISLGPAQMKPSVVYELIDQGFIKKPNGWDEDKVDITIRWLLNPGSSATLVNARLKQIVQHWAKGGVDISDRPDVLGTLYSIGLTGKSGINPDPKANERGEKIANQLMKRVKEILACPDEVPPKKPPEGTPPGNVPDNVLPKKTPEGTPPGNVPNVVPPKKTDTPSYLA